MNLTRHLLHQNHLLHRRLIVVGEAEAMNACSSYISFPFGRVG